MSSFSAANLNDVSLLDSDRIRVSRNGRNFVLTTSSSSNCNIDSSLFKNTNKSIRLNPECGIYKVNQTRNRKKIYNARSVDSAIISIRSTPPNTKSIAIPLHVENVSILPTNSVTNNQDHLNQSIHANFETVDDKFQHSVAASSNFILPPGTIIESDVLDFGNIMELGGVQQFIVSNPGFLPNESPESPDTLTCANLQVPDKEYNTPQITKHRCVQQGSADITEGLPNAVFKIELLNNSAADDYSLSNCAAGILGDPSFNEDDTDSKSNKSIDTRSQFACRHCGKLYRWKSTVRRHEMVECGGKAPSYSCPYCDYKAKQHGNLGVHVRKHHPDRPQLASRRSLKKDRE